MTSMAFERQKLPNGNENPKYIDLLDEDKPISGQKYACISFVSPENILEDKNRFFFQEFLKYFDFSKSIEKYHQFLSFLGFKYNLEFNDLITDFEEFLKSEKDSFNSEKLRNDYKTFVDNNEQRLQDDFDTTHNFQTNTRGLKIRGVYATQGEAELRCKLLREVDPNHNVYVGPIGMWMPWDPEAYKTGRVEYMEEELNQLMSEKNKNEEKAKQEFEKRVLETKRKAIEENIKLAKENKNKLTQNIDKEGNLYGVNNTIENSLTGENITSADIKKELFEGDNIITSKNNDKPKLKSLLPKDDKE
tara:strand:- start:9936 stop:10847 length:912 start_codon:yes stop_codon:yes gene_type:complete